MQCLKNERKAAIYSLISAFFLHLNLFLLINLKVKLIIFNLF